MGLLRWLLWPRRSSEDFETKRRRARGKPTRKARQPGVYRIEVDNEVGRFHGDGPPFSFWSSSRIILILSFLLWWIQPAGPMIAGYVGGRRAGSPIKAVTAALLPVFAIYIANLTYAHNFSTHQVDFVATLPLAISDAAASILPFLVPYKEFMVSYLRGFVEALTTTFGMGTNGYLMVIIFSYIGGLIGDQARREISFKAGSGSSIGVNLLQPLFGARAHHVDDEEEAYEEDEEIHRSRRPLRARAHRRAYPVISNGPRRHRRRSDDYFDDYRKVPAEIDEFRRERRAVRTMHADDDEDDEDEEDEVVVTRTHRVPRSHEERREVRHSTRAKERVDEEPEPAPARAPRIRSPAEERAIQRFVERALRNYDHSKL